MELKFIKNLKESKRTKCKEKLHPEKRLEYRQLFATPVRDKHEQTVTKVSDNKYFHDTAWEIRGFCLTTEKSAQQQRS